MAERTYVLKYSLSDGQTGLEAGSFTVTDGDEGDILSGTGTYDIGWGYPEESKGRQYGNRVNFGYDNNDPDTAFDPADFSEVFLAEENYYRCNNSIDILHWTLDNINLETETYIGKDGEGERGKDGVYITAISLEAV